MTTSYRSLLVIFVTAFLLTGYNFLGASWTPATGTPPASNTEAPVNVGTVTQAKSGNLSANIFAATTEVRSNRYCDALGLNCFSATSTPGGGGDTIDVGGQCFEPAYLVVCNWNWSGDGNDDSTVLANFNSDPTQGCRTSSRTYVRHSVILAECGIDAYYWSATAWEACVAPPASCGQVSGSQSRAVACKRTIDDVTVADSFCRTAKPAVSQLCTRNYGNCGRNH